MPCGTSSVVHGAPNPDPKPNPNPNPGRAWRRSPLSACRAPWPCYALGTTPLHSLHPLHPLHPLHLCALCRRSR